MNQEQAFWQVWVVDDLPENRTMIGRSFSAVAELVELTEISSGSEFRERLTEVTEGFRPRPHFVFLDFFLGDCYGTELIGEVLSRAQVLERPILIAHSSMDSANHGMVAAGADFLLPKRRGLPWVESIRLAFSSPAAVGQILTSRRLPGED